MLGRLGDDRLLVLFIDDLQWGDVDSGRLLREIMRPPDAPPILLLASFRSDDRANSPIFQEMAGTDEEEQPALEIALSELSVEESLHLALSHLEDDSAEARARARELAQEAGGSPFFMAELVRHGGFGNADSTDPVRLESVIESRLAILPDDARRLLDCFAVADRPLELSIANQVAGLDPGDTTAIDVLRVENWLRERSGTGRDILEPYHDRIRETVAALVPDEDLSSYHNRLGHALDLAGEADAETLAEHYLRSGEDELAARHALRAADQAANALAFDRAARLYEMGLGLWEPATQDTRQSLRIRWADALANAGRGEEAARAYLEVAKKSVPRERLELRRIAAEQFLNSGLIDEGLEVLQSVLREVGMRLPGSPWRALVALLMRRARLRIRGLGYTPRRESEIDEQVLQRVDICWTAGAGLAMVDVIPSAHFQSKHLHLALRAGEPARVARALITELGISSASGSRQAKRTAALLERCRQLVEELDQPYARGWLATAEGISANLRGDFVTALERARRGEEILRGECTGVTWERDTALLYELHSLVNLGRWRGLTTRAYKVLQEALERDDLYLSSYILTRNRFVEHLLDDQPEQARAAQEVGLGSWSRQGFHVQHYWDWYARGEIDLYAGNPTRGWARIAAQWREFKRSLLPLTQSLAIETRFLRARIGIACAIDDPGQSNLYLGQAQADAKWLHGEKSRWAESVALSVDAGVESVQGDLGRARELAAEAAEALNALGIEHYAEAASRRADAGSSKIDLRDDQSWLAVQRVENPERMLAMLSPGKWT